MADEDSSISWIRWTGKSRFRSLARPGDMVVQIWQSLSGRQMKVLEHCAIVLRQDSDPWTRFYVEDREDTKSLSWKRFQKQARARGISRISKGTVRELNPREALVLEAVWS